jgi:hypothetical protein
MQELYSLPYYTWHIFTERNLGISIPNASLNIQIFTGFINFVYFCLIRRMSIKVFQYVLSHIDSNCFNKTDCFNIIYTNVVARKNWEFSASFYFRWHWRVINLCPLRCDTVNSSIKAPSKRWCYLNRGRHIAGNNLNILWRSKLFRI